MLPDVPVFRLSMNLGKIRSKSIPKIVKSAQKCQNKNTSPHSCLGSHLGSKDTISRFANFYARKKREYSLFLRKMKPFLSYSLVIFTYSYRFQFKGIKL